MAGTAVGNGEHKVGAAVQFGVARHRRVELRRMPQLEGVEEGGRRGLSARAAERSKLFDCGIVPSEPVTFRCNPHCPI